MGSGPLAEVLKAASASFPLRLACGEPGDALPHGRASDGTSLDGSAQAGDSATNVRAGTPAPRQSAPRRWLPGLALAAIAFATYANTLGAGFVADDREWIVGNDAVRSLSTVWRAFAQGQLHNRVFRPVPLAWFTLDYAIARLSPWFYHLENVLLHALVTLLVWRLLKPFGRRVAWLAAAAFAVLPVHTEAVANITSRSELAAAMFALLALMQVRTARRASGGHAWLRLALAGVLMMLAAMSKETALAVPLLAPLLWWEAGSEEDRRASDGSARLWSILALAALVAGIIGYLALQLHARCCVLFPSTLLYGQLDNPLRAASWLERVRTALMIFGQNFAVSFFPYHFSVDYSYNQIPLVNRWIEARFLLWTALPAAALCLAFLARQRWPNLLRGIAWFVIALAPASNLVFMIGTIRGERLLYIPSIGACLVIGQALALLFSARRRWAIAAAMAVLLTLALVAGNRNRVWQSQEAFTASMVRDAPNSARAHFQAGGLLMLRRDCAGAIPHLRRAVQIFPGYEVAHLALTACQGQQRQPAR